MSEDRFSKQSDSYALYRPDYPEELFSFLALHTPGHELAWDCATGTGQAARSLAKHFDTVVATDLSAEQISKATAPSNVRFSVSSVEELVVPHETVDLITVAQGVHWFDLQLFYDMAQKSLKPKGILAVWGYGFFKISPEIDSLLDPYGRETLAPYWSEKNWLLINGYRDLPFPFRKISHPPFKLKVSWDFNHLKGYLESWSATQKFKDQRGSDPFDQIRSKLEALWGDPLRTYEITWDLHLLMGQK